MGGVDHLQDSSLGFRVYGPPTHLLIMNVSNMSHIVPVSKPFLSGGAWLLLANVIERLDPFCVRLNM